MRVVWEPKESGRSLTVVRRVGVLSLGKVLGVLYALLGPIVGALFAVISLLGAAVGAANSQASDAFAGLLFGVRSVVFLPIFYRILGFVFGLTGALFYNGIARLLGGIGIELEETRHASSSYYSYASWGRLN
jgi:hypothetical protein